MLKHTRADKLSHCGCMCSSDNLQDQHVARDLNYSESCASGAVRKVYTADIAATAAHFAHMR